MKILVVNGPNLNLLGHREPDTYGTNSLDQIMSEVVDLGVSLGVTVAHMQSNHEGELIDAIQEARASVDGLVVNPGGFGHSSVSLRDALLAVALPFVEVHLSNIHAREPFRHRTLLSDAAVGTIAGFGGVSYSLGLRGLVAHLRATEQAGAHRSSVSTSGESA